MIAKTNSTRRIGLYSESAIIGGAERSMLNLAVSYRGSAHLVIVSPSVAVLDAAAEIVPNVERQKIETAERGISGFLQLRRQLRTLDLSLLQVTLPNPFDSRSVQLAAFSLRLATITVQQLVIPSRRGRGAWMVRLFAAPLAGTIAVGERTAADLERFFGISRSRIRVVHNGIAPASPAPVEFVDGPTIGCVARFEPQKGLDRLIRAVVELPDVYLVLVGDGSLRQDLIDLSKELGVEDRVEVGPWRDDARDLIAAFDVFALASLDEAFPLTIVEAMLARTPIIATDVGSVGEAVIDGETGLLVRSGDHKGLVSGLRLLLEDSKLAARLSLNGHDLAMRRFTAERMAEGYDAVWRAWTAD